MEKYQSCILHHWKQATANSPSADRFLKQHLRNTLQLSVVAHRVWFVLTYFRWPEARICHETAELYSKYFQWLSPFHFCPSEAAAGAVSAAEDDSFQHSSWGALLGQGKSSAAGQSTSNPRKLQPGQFSLQAPLQNWEPGSAGLGLKLLLIMSLCCGTSRDFKGSKSPLYPWVSFS